MRKASHLAFSGVGMGRSGKCLEITSKEEPLKFKKFLALKGEDLRWNGFRRNTSNAFKYMIKPHVGNCLDLFRVALVWGNYAQWLEVTTEWRQFHIRKNFGIRCRPTVELALCELWASGSSRGRKQWLRRGWWLQVLLLWMVKYSDQ